MEKNVDVMSNLAGVQNVADVQNVTSPEEQFKMAEKCLSELIEKHVRGEGVTGSDVEAIKWLRKAAEQGHVKAQVKLGNFYSYGWYCLEKSEKEAVKWFKLAFSGYLKIAEQGDVEAQFTLGDIYFNGYMGYDHVSLEDMDLKDDNGNKVEKSYLKAFAWYAKAAEQGHAQAQYNLARMYFKGCGTDQSYAEALNLLKKVSEQNECDPFLKARAQFEVGTMYKKGLGVPQSYEEAARWYLKVAEWGHYSAQCELGKMYEKGLGVPQSDEEAVKWYEKAAEQGSEYAKQKLSEMKK